MSISKYHVNTNKFEGFNIIGKVPSVSNGELVDQGYGATTSLIPVDSWLFVMAANFTTANNLYLFLYDDVADFVGYAQITSSGIIKSVDVSGYMLASFVRIRVDNLASFTADNGTIMFNDGLEPLPYEPFISDNLLDILSNTSFMSPVITIDDDTIYLSSISQYNDTRILYTKKYSAGTYTISFESASGDLSNLRFLCSAEFTGSTWNSSYNSYYKDLSNKKLTFTTSTEFTIGFAFLRKGENSGSVTGVMFNSGSTAKPYTPYGTTWKDWYYRKYGTETDTITTLPKQIIGDGTALSAWEIDGNMQQQGTPSLSSPIYPSETGERTENLIEGIVNNALIYTNGVITQTNDYSTLYAPVTPGETYTFNYSASNIDTAYVYGLFSTKPQMGSTTYNNSRSVASYNQNPTITITIPSDITYIGLRIPNTALSRGEGIMFVKGSTPKPYEPHGYKLPVSCGETITNIYLSEPIRKLNDYIDTTSSSGVVVRKIIKIIFDGTETNWVGSNTTVGRRFNIPVPNINESFYDNPKSLCSHAILGNTATTGGTYSISYAGTTTTRLIIKLVDDTITTADQLKQWLAAQYAAGTPLTLWAIRDVSETESFTAPTIPTTGTAENFDVATTLKPSEVTLTYHGWHEHEDTEFTT